MKIPLSLLQGIYYGTTGFWPLLSMRTFEAITGPKQEDWLVKTAGLLIGVDGVALTLAGLQTERSREIGTLGLGSALGLAAVDFVYVWKGTIPPVYLADAVVEAGFVTGWLYNWLQSTSATGE